MPFELKNAAKSFQWLMDSVCKGLDSVFVYIDDILVASRNTTQCKLHLHQLLQCRQEHGLVLNMAKCEIGQTTIDFLGYHIMKEGAMPQANKVEVITKFKQPVTLKRLQQFMDMVNFYHRFILSAAQIMPPLFAALTSNIKTVAWNEGMIKAFQDTKAVLAGVVLRTRPGPIAATSLILVSSEEAVGAVLQQQSLK